MFDYQQAKSRLSEPFSSWEAFDTFIRAPDVVQGEARVGNARWSNRDVEPTPVKERTWNWYNLPTYWMTTTFSPTGWNVASSLIAVGLTWEQALISAIIGSFISGLMVVAMARPGAVYHVGFPVIARMTYGMYGAYFFIALRSLICAIWFGVNTFYGGNLLSVCLRCIFGDKWHSWPNTLPESSNVTSKQLLCFFIVWLMQFPFTWLHPSKIQYVFNAKGVLLPVATFGIFGWAIHNGAGLSSSVLDLASARGAAAASTTPLGWSIMSGINVILGTLSPMLVNQSDLARYTKKPWHAGWLQGLTLFLFKVLVLFLGMAATVSMQGVWGQAYWNIWDFLSAILDHNWTPAGRAGVFLVSFAYVFSIFGSNFGSNSIPFGSDVAGLLPQYLTIKRGQIICAILGICVCPWELLTSASTFLTFLGSYNIFMSPLCAIILVDYLLVRRGNYHIPSAYRAKKGDVYWYWGGVNWLGSLCWVGGMSLGLPGLVAQFQPAAVGDGAKNLYRLGWIICFTAASALYYASTRFVKMRIVPKGYESLHQGSFEYMGRQGREGFFPGERDGGDARSSASNADGEATQVGEVSEVNKA